MQCTFTATYDDQRMKNERASNNSKHNTVQPLMFMWPLFLDLIKIAKF